VLGGGLGREELATDAVLVLEGDAFPEPSGGRLGPGEEQVTGAPVPDVDAERLLEALPDPDALPREVDAHAGGELRADAAVGPAGAPAAERSLLHDGHVGAPVGEVVRARQADDATADDHDAHGEANEVRD